MNLETGWINTLPDAIDLDKHTYEPFLYSLKILEGVAEA
ncbi:hypothetical protein GHAL_1717 [Hafnia alvei ATCC 13337]|uniref:Uncharacterized protein n=1 Tax=Hafnia alvei ATCC 13337 TaxID=910996 RepID=A0ABD3ZI06_HAFAL|nr:hypothetical protein GHAL_1717 [Hafnia alvei ATCC 13337]